MKQIDSGMEINHGADILVKPNIHGYLSQRAIL